ncbi:MAG: GAF domain-containing protein, partial [Chloroflexi bacterium]|nr:GAF domain-containing protein [Chloroflexota bacterium]
MLQGQSALLAIGLLLTGLVFYLLVWGLLRFTARIPPAGGKMSSRQTGDSSIHKHAILLVRPGGTLDYLNQVAHEWFDLRQGEQPNLETLARRIQPRVDFLQLCANEGQARFSLNGRPVDGISYLVPGGDGCLLLTLRAPDLSAGLGETGPGVQSAALKILADFSATAAIEQGLASAIRNVLENIERLVPSELLQVQVWDAVEKNLAAYRLATGAAGERSLEVAKPLPPSGYAARIVAEHLPLLVADTRADASAEPAAMGQAAPRSYMGLPFISGGELVGVLEVGLPAPDAFSQEDLGLLQLVAGQAAAVIRNAAMLEEEQKRSAELGGLAHLAQAIGSARDQHDLFNRLVQSLTPLFDVEVLGFLVYNESRRLLEAQAPFVGIPPQVVELYHVPIQPGSQGEQVFLSQELVLAANAAEDDSWQALGLQDFARAASLRDAALVPLISGGRSLGYLQVSNHRTATAFQASEIRLLHIIANQAAAIIDNAALVQQARQRAQRADALLRIASLTSSSATLDEILRFALQELARMLQADAAAIFLLDESQGMLRLHPESLWGVDPALAEPIARLYVDDPQFHFSVTGSQRSFLSGHLSDDKRVLPLYRPIVDVLKIESAIVVPLVVRERGIGELMLSSKKGDFFNSYDLQIVATTAGQLAAAVEGTSLSAQTDENLRRRVDQLTELNRINRELSAAVERRHLLQVVYDESLRAARAECGSILLFAPGHVGSESPVVQASQGEEPVGLLLPAESQVFATGKPLIIPDFEAGDFEPPHEGVASALLAPIAHRDQVRGLIHLHSSIAGRFDDSSLEIIQTMAFQAAIALENNQRFQDQRQQGEALHRQVEALSGLLQLTRSLGTELPLEESLAGLAQGIQQASRFQMVLISVVDPVTEMQQRVAGAGIPPETMSVLKSRQQPWSALQQLLRPEFKQAGGYFIPNDRTPVVSSELQMVTLLTGPAADAPNAWNPEDTLLFPLFDEQEQPIGLISLDAPSNGLRPDRAVMETIDLYAATVALVIRASRRLETYRTQAETMNVSIQRQQQFYSVSQGHLPVMLHKDLEQMVSIRNIERRARRLRAGLEITEIINRQVDAQSALLALGAEMLTRLEMSVSIVAESGAEGPRLLHVLGQIPRGVSAEALFGQRNPLRQSLQTGETLLVMNLDEDETWRDTPLLTSLHAKGFICLPIILDEQPVAGILALSPEPMAALTEEDRQVYYQIARQVSIILQNIGLLGETRRRLREVNLLLDFSRQLGGL